MRNIRVAIAALALPLLAGCSDLVSNQTMGPPAPPVHAGQGTMFDNYIALGTSISAGFQSGGINDSTQKQSFPYLLAQAMGTTLGVNWTYPSFNMPGCPPPFTDPLTGARVTPPGYPTSTDTSCYILNPVYIRPFTNNLGVPSIRAAQVLNLQNLAYPATDTLSLVQFITGSRNPIDELLAAKPTFVTLEIGANDVLGAATHGNAALLTPMASFEASYMAIADSVEASLVGTVKGVAVANVPNVDIIPHFSAGVIFWCLHNGGAYCPAAAGLPPATLPYSSPLFVVDSSCIASALYPSKGVGDKMLVAFPATGTITGVLAAGGAATLNCAAGTATVNKGAGFVAAGPVLTPAAVAAIATEVVEIDSFIHLQAIARGWAYVDLNGALAQARAGGQIPAFPNFTNPAALFGPIFSYDGVHPNAAGHKVIADLFIAAINATYSTGLVAP